MLFDDDPPHGFYLFSMLPELCQASQMDPRIHRFNYRNIILNLSLPPFTCLWQLNPLPPAKAHSTTESVASNNFSQKYSFISLSPLFWLFPSTFDVSYHPLEMPILRIESIVHRWCPVDLVQFYAKLCTMFQGIGP